MILEELAMDDDSPEDVVHRAFGAAVFGDHPLGWDTAGDRASVRGLTADAVRSFYGGHYVTENTVVAVAGAVDPDEVVDEVDQGVRSVAIGGVPPVTADRLMTSR